MVREGVGRLPVVSRGEPRKVVGMLTRSDLLTAHKSRLEEIDLAERHFGFRIRPLRRNGEESAAPDDQGRARARNIV
jgi:predicted transcriptional regulator